MSQAASSQPAPQDKNLGFALKHALEFPLTRMPSLLVPAGKAAEMAEQEAAFGTVTIDQFGMSPGMSVHLLQPLRTAVSEWRQQRAGFDTAIAPKQADLRAVREAEEALASVERERDEALASLEKKLHADINYEKVSGAHNVSLSRWTELRDKEAGRKPTMLRYSPIYPVALLSIGVAEWFINYDTLLLFTGVQAIAAASTLILAILMAFAAHAHGETLKQWSFMFSESRSPSERAGYWRLFGLGTVALLLVLGAAGAARYAAAMQILLANLPQSGGIDLGVGTVDVNPTRDVVISMLANVAAWLVGVFIAYMAHDQNPKYMAATRQYDADHAALRKATAHVEKDKRHIEAKFMETINEKRTAAQTRARSVAEELKMETQMDAHAEAIGKEAEQVLRSNIETYRDCLTRIALGEPGRVKLVSRINGAQISPFELKSFDMPGTEAMHQMVGL